MESLRVDHGVAVVETMHCRGDNFAKISGLEISEKLNRIHMKCTDCNGMLPTSKEVNSQAQERP